MFGTPALQEFVQKTVSSNDAHWALMEVGGGRSPLLDESQYRSLRVQYTVNDISASELELAPNWTLKACFDICSPPSTTDASFDLIFSKMVFEHLRDARAAYQAVYRLLTPGGIALAFFPTLYCLPFVMNYFSPERLSSKLQRILDPRANPKFPAYYSWCRSTASLKRNLETIGFRQIAVSAFYGHAYYRSIPLLRELERHWAHMAMRNDLRPLSSFAYAFMQK